MTIRLNKGFAFICSVSPSHNGGQQDPPPPLRSLNGAGIWGPGAAAPAGKLKKKENIEKKIKGGLKNKNAYRFIFRRLNARLCLGVALAGWVQEKEEGSKKETNKTQNPQPTENQRFGVLNSALVGTKLRARWRFF